MYYYSVTYICVSNIKVRLNHSTMRTLKLIRNFLGSIVYSLARSGTPPEATVSYAEYRSQIQLSGLTVAVSQKSTDSTLRNNDLEESGTFVLA